MRGGGIDLVRRAVAYMAVDDNQRRPARGLPEDRERILDLLPTVGIADPQHVPAICEAAYRHILREGDARVALDGNVVVVVDPTQVVEAEMTGQRGRLRADPFHQAAVAANCINIIVEEIEAGPVVAAGKPFPRDRHADTRGDSLTERTCRRLDPRRPMIFRVTRRFAVELAEVADVVESDRRLAQAFILRVHRPGARQMQYGPQQHRGMSV